MYCTIHLLNIQPAKRTKTMNTKRKRTYQNLWQKFVGNQRRRRVWNVKNHRIMLKNIYQFSKYIVTVLHSVSSCYDLFIHYTTRCSLETNNFYQLSKIGMENFLFSTEIIFFNFFLLKLQQKITIYVFNVN